MRSVHKTSLKAWDCKFAGFCLGIFHLLGTSCKGTLYSRSVFAHGLRLSGEDDVKDTVFTRLLGEADRADLRGVQSDGYYVYRNPEFRAVIEQALLTANPAGSRPSTLEKAQRVKEVVSEIISASVGKERFTDIIASYIVE